MAKKETKLSTTGLNIGTDNGVVVVEAKDQTVFAGTPDARQGGDIIVSRFRPVYRALSNKEKALHDEIKAQAERMEALFAQAGAGRYSSLALTSLEESVMWAVKQLTA